MTQNEAAATLNNIASRCRNADQFKTALAQAMPDATADIQHDGQSWMGLAQAHERFPGVVSFSSAQL